MFEFLIQNKLLVMIGLSQFGLVLMVFMIINLSQRKLGKSNMSNPNLNLNTNPTSSAAIAASRLNNVIKTIDQPTDQLEIDSSSISNLQELNPAIPAIPLDLPELVTDMQNQTGDRPDANPESDMYKVAISPDLFTELLEISNNPAETVDEAIRWWLRRRTLNALETSIDRDRRDRLSSRSYSSKRSQQELWND